MVSSLLNRHYGRKYNSKSSRIRRSSCWKRTKAVLPSSMTTTLTPSFTRTKICKLSSSSSSTSLCWCHLLMSRWAMKRTSTRRPLLSSSITRAFQPKHPAVVIRPSTFISKIHMKTIKAMKMKKAKRKYWKIAMCRKLPVKMMKLHQRQMRVSLSKKQITSISKKSQDWKSRHHRLHLSPLWAVMKTINTIIIIRLLLISRIVKMTVKIGIHRTWFKTAASSNKQVPEKPIMAAA